MKDDFLTRFRRIVKEIGEDKELKKLISSCHCRKDQQVIHYGKCFNCGYPIYRKEKK